MFDHPVDAVLLDAGGVLLLPDPAAMRRAVAPFGAVPDDETCRFAHYAGTREIDRIGRADWPAADRVIAAVLGVPDEQVEHTLAPLEEMYLSEAWIPVPGANDALLALQAAGVPLAVVSNAGGTMERQLLSHRICAAPGAVAGTAQERVAEVAIVVDSHVVGIEKPDPRIFALALDALGIEAHRCAYVGDTVFFDVAGARAAGLFPIHVDPYELCPHDDHPHVASVAAIVEPLASRT